MTDTQPPVSMKELRDRWGLSANALKARAKALGIELLRPSGNSSYWPGDKVELGEQLHQWLADGHAMSLFPAVQQASGQSSLTRKSPSTDASVTALVPIRQQMQDLRQEDPLALARRLVEAACPLEQEFVYGGSWAVTVTMSITVIAASICRRQAD